MMRRGRIRKGNTVPSSNQRPQSRTNCTLTHGRWMVPRTLRFSSPLLKLAPTAQTLTRSFQIQLRTL
ncbi:hypothetical protein B296_00012808 [Ensete ventricosum]|uniref:Uncharacterized protein n=1 Tax=Ensete ventricosum TaxID=4639 RepID=A0A426ZCK4_ENSVE|nr:hypothetical protein B296_00012808 [Ensete ventricosum]